MDDDTSRTMHAAVLRWIQKLDLPIEESELTLQRGIVCENGENRLEYGRIWNGFPVFEYQYLSMILDPFGRVISIHLRWDDIDFDLPTKYLSETEIRRRISTGNLYLLPAPLGRGLLWIVQPVKYDAVTGELIHQKEEGY